MEVQGLASEFLECERCRRAVPADDIDENGWCDICAQEVHEDEVFPDD